MAYSDITGLESIDLATDPEKAELLAKMGDLLEAYRNAKEKDNTHKHENNRNSGQDR